MAFSPRICFNLGSVPSTAKKDKGFCKEKLKGRQGKYKTSTSFTLSTYSYMCKVTLEERRWGKA